MGCGKLLVVLLLTVFLSQFSSALTAEEQSAKNIARFSDLSSRLSSLLESKDAANLKNLAQMSEMMRETKQALISAFKPSQFAQLSQQTQEDTSPKGALNLTQPEAGKAIQDCIAALTDMATQIAKIQSGYGQLAEIILTDITSLVNCLQGGVTAETMTCITNVVSGVPKSLSELETETMQSITVLQSDITKLSTCVASKTPPATGTGTNTGT